MSCQKCTEAQREMGYDANGQATTDPDQMVSEPQPVPIHYTYIRIGHGNVLISGCQEHLGRLIEYYRLGAGRGEA